MAPVPDLVLMCLAMSYSDFRSSEWWQIGSGEEGEGVTHSSSWLESTMETHTQEKEALKHIHVLL